MTTEHTPTGNGSTATQGSPTIHLKALGPNRTPINGGTGTWPDPGTWTPDIDPIPCEQGWHVCTPTQMLTWLPDTTNDIWLAEIGGTVIDHGDKTVAQRARLIHKLDWTDRTARLFAADCAEAVLHLYETAYPGDDRPRKAIEAARQYALGEATNEERDAAWAAAEAATEAATRAAAWAAAWDAAWDATRDATRDAAEDATLDATWAAAWAAAWDAAWAAAWAAAWDAQGELLVKHLGDAQGELLVKHLGVVKP